jgi:hypothetical protein
MNIIFLCTLVFCTPLKLTKFRTIIEAHDEGDTGTTTILGTGARSNTNKVMSEGMGEG